MGPRKLTTADIDKVRDIEGFPIATDEAIIELSDAPYYTACPNPFIEEFITENGSPYNDEADDYHCEPFAADVSEGKNEPIYNAHAYHTKVPYKAIMRYLLHYTSPGDIVFDGFCGTGMTGVAAQMCAQPDNAFRMQIESEMPSPEWGIRHAVLSDLSPAATYFARCFNLPVDRERLLNSLKALLIELRGELGWMYKTQHTINGVVQKNVLGEPVMGDINFTVWSDVLICPTCSHELVYWDAAIDPETEKVSKTFPCPNCGAALTKTTCSRAMETTYDNRLNKTVTTARQTPVRINYTVNGKRYIKKPDSYDMQLVSQISSMDIPYWYPTERMPEGRESRRNDRYGITHIHQFYTKRNLWGLAAAYAKADQETRFALTAITKIMTKMFRWAPHGKHTAGMPGTLYMPSVTHEYPIMGPLERRIKLLGDLAAARNCFNNDVIVSCGDSSMTTIPDNSIDYIFTDPPFGSNLDYSELSFIWESWLRVKTNNAREAIMNDVQGKGLHEYQQLMTDCFVEFYRVLKPERWMTVEFHNSQNSVWNAIQQALQRSGFVIADVRTLDKKQASFKQINNTSAVKQDLVISAYKPAADFTQFFDGAGSTTETAWAFVRQHLENLPVAVITGGRIELIAERQSYLLYDRMVAYHVMKGIAVPIDAADFYRGLDERYVMRDEMFFLPEQINEYESVRMTTEVEPIQFAMLVTNEKTAIGWLYQLLANEPMTYQQIQPMFMQEVKTIDRYEALPELAVLLEENFLQDEKGRWYVPDTKKEGDVAKLREKSLLREFDGYLKSKGKLKLFRSEAIRVGFSHLWKDHNYQAIVDLANRLPAATIQEDPNLLMYYDISLSRIG